MRASLTTRIGLPARTTDILRRLSVFIILLAICLVFALGSDDFLTPSNLLNVALQTSILIIVAIGMTFTILTAGIDLSVGSLMALGGAPPEAEELRVLNLLQVLGSDAPRKRAIIVAGGSQLSHQRIQVPLDRQQDTLTLGRTATGPRQANCCLGLVHRAIGFGT
jgi:hypothetical protein